MSKRSAEVQITKENNNSGEKVRSGTWTSASQEKISKRKILKVRRKSGTASPAPTPAYHPAFKFAESKQETENAFAKLIPANTWECKTCLVRNKDILKKCAACEEPNPNMSFDTKKVEAESEVKNGIFTFGSADNSTSVASPSVASPFVSGSTSGFSFGTDNPNPFSFGTSSTVSFSSEGGASNFTWGTPASSETSSESTKVPAGLFQFTTQQSLSKPSDPSPGKSGFQEEKEQKSGEEKDRILHKVHTKVYTLKQVPITKSTEVGDKKKENGPPKMKDKYVESGSGELHINVMEEKGNTRARMVLRVDKTQRLVLNAPIFPEMIYSMEGDKYVRFTSKDLQNNSTVFLVKFRNKSETLEVKSYIEKCINLIKRDRPDEKADEVKANVDDDDDESEEEESQV